MEIFKAKLDIKRNVPFVLEAILEIGIGTILLVKHPGAVLGILFVVVGIVQLIRKLKTFHLIENELLIKRPLLPLKFLEDRFPLDSIVMVEFKMIKGRFGGPHLTVRTKENADSFRIEVSKEVIHLFAGELNRLGIKTEREGP